MCSIIGAESSNELEEKLGAKSGDRCQR